MTTHDNTHGHNSGHGSDWAGFVPRLDADPAAARYEQMRPAQAVDRIAEVGFGRADAEHMVAEYLADQTARHGEPHGGWQVDPYDLAEIARRYEWVDHYRGETLAQARDRAGQYAAGWTDRAGQIDPGPVDPQAAAARIGREIELWTDRTTPTQPPMPEWMREQARATEAEIAAGTYEPGPPDDPARLAARLDELRAQAAEREADHEAGRSVEGEALQSEDPRSSTHMMAAGAAAALSAARGSAEDDARREQLTRWHTDDTTDHAADSDGVAEGSGRSTCAGVRFVVTDDGPGQP